MLELIIDTIGKEDEALARLKDFGAEMSPDAVNSFLLPDTTDKAAVEGVLQSVGIEYQWVEDEGDLWLLPEGESEDDTTILLKDDEEEEPSK